MQLGKEKIYNDNFLKKGLDNIVRWDVLKINTKQEFYLEIISTNSNYKQGVRLAIDSGNGYVEINGIQAKEMHLWEDTVPKRIHVKCFSEEGVLSVYNVFDMGKERGGIRSQMDSCGMIIGKKDNKLFYYCNDAGFNSDFDKLVFSIEMF